MNWTKVGLKVRRAKDSILQEIGLNWTKVGLKGDENISRAGRGLRLNWTKVGLKVAFRGGGSSGACEFELD